MQNEPYLNNFIGESEKNAKQTMFELLYARKCQKWVKKTPKMQVRT